MLGFYIDSEIDNYEIIAKYLHELYPSNSKKNIINILKRAEIYKYIIIDDNYISITEYKTSINNYYGISIFTDEIYLYDICDENSFLIRNNKEYKTLIKFLIKEKYFKTSLDANVFLMKLEYLNYEFTLIINNKVYNIYDYVTYELFFKNNIKEYSITEYLRYMKIKQLL